MADPAPIPQPEPLPHSPRSTASLSSSSTAVDPSSPSPLMANLNRLSQATSRPNLPPPEGIAARTVRKMSAGLGWTPDKADELDDLILRRTHRPITPIDTSSILYPTLENHPAPAAHPLLVLNLAAATAVPAHVGNDELLELLLHRLEPWVGEQGEGGYCLIVLAAERAEMEIGGSKKGRALPGVAWWLWHWRRIPRKFRKNLKRLYIVHPSTLTRTVLPLILPLVSPKSYSKVHIVPSLVALTHFNVSLRGMDLPLSTLTEEARVLHENPDAARRSSITNAAGRRASITPLPRSPSPRPSPPPAPEGIAWGTLSALTSVLGTATSWLHPGVAEALSDKPQQRYWAREIDDIVVENHGHVPRIVGAIGSAVLTYSTGTEGIFRRSANTNLVHTLQALLDLPLHLQPRLDWGVIAQADPLLPPIMLKKILAALTPPVFAQSTYPIIRSTRSVDDIATKLLPSISAARTQILDVILHIAHHLLPHETTTRMGALQLALMLAPSLVSGPDPREDLQLLMEFGAKVPAGLGPAGADAELEVAPQTLVGVLEMWIASLPEVHGRKGPCECGLGKAKVATGPAPAPAPVPAAPATGQHALLNAQSASTHAPPVETASSS